MTQEISNLLDMLAAKYGTTTAHLWEAMVRQQVIYGWSILACVLIVAAIFVTLSIRCAIMLRCARADRRIEDAGFWFGFLIVSIVVVAVTVFAVIMSSGYLIGSIVNPEYFALKDILGILN